MGVPRSQNFGPVPSSNSNFGHQRRSQGSVSVRKYTNMLSSSKMPNKRKKLCLFKDNYSTFRVFRSS